MPNHPFGNIDREDRRQAYAEARASWFTIGFAVALGVFAALVHTGVV